MIRAREADILQTSLQAYLSGLRRQVRDERQAQEVRQAPVYCDSHVAPVERKSKARHTPNGIKTRRVVCCVDKTCISPPRNLCIICEQQVCDYHSDGRLWARRDALGELTTGHACSNCIFEAERQYERGYISLASAAAISTITVEDAIRVQKIMEKIRES